MNKIVVFYSSREGYIIVLEFRQYKRLDDEELTEKAVAKINEIKHVPYEGNEHIYVSHMQILNDLIREIKLRGLTLEENRMIKNILIDFK